MASSSSTSTFLIKFHRGGVFVRDPFSYDYDMLSEIKNVNVSELGYVGLVKLLVAQCASDIQQFFYVVPGLDLEAGLRSLKNEADLKKCVELGEKHGNVLDIYVSHSVFELHDATSPNALPQVENVQPNDDSDSDLEGDYNIFEYDTEEESDTASIDHLSDGEEELFEVRTKKPDAPKTKSKKMFDENFLTRVYNGLPRDGYAGEDDVAPKYRSLSQEDDDRIGDHWPVHNPDIKWKLMKPHLVPARGGNLPATQETQMSTPQEPSTPPHLIVPTQMSTPPPGFEMNAPSGGVTTRSGGKRFRGGGVTMRGGGVTTRGGGVTTRGGGVTMRGWGR
ncbi:hypothetical protein CTI12_AA005660 [Artemisia annua]|uniref:PB1-like domain-containing protein n=1 Tax=Artemisia annua TaxID=35608 RepID=A0A2U1QNQ2_ARTAN|nr:hypothetical protein CTI12_AA005660 [Artemisia annua]